MTILSIPNDVVLTVRRGTVTSPGKVAELTDVRRGAATLVYERHLTHPGTAAWLARIALGQHGYTVREVILEGMGADITALFREASRLRLNVELGSRVDTPRVAVRGDGPASYMVPKGWDLADATDRLPAAHTAARPAVARTLHLIEEEKRSNGGVIDTALDTAAGMILETGDPDWVWDALTGVLAALDEKAQVPA